MTEELLFVIVGSLFALGAVTLAVAALTLHQVRKYVELAEARMEHFRQEHTRLMVLLREEQLSLQEQAARERQRRVEAEQEHASPENLARRDAERRIDDLKRELLGLQAVRQENASGLREEPSADMPATRDPYEESGHRAQKAQATRAMPRPTGFPETSSKPAQNPHTDGRPRLAVWHPHPDDDVSPARVPAGHVPVGGDSPVKMFRRHYDRYLENYEGYVKLAERLHQMRECGEVPSGSPAEREWRERLRRVNDSIDRTTARLDILEEYNPELATDDRISRRASIARSHWGLARVEDSGKTSP